MKLLFLLVVCFILTACSTPGRLTTTDQFGHSQVTVVKDCNVIFDKDLLCIGTDGKEFVAEGVIASYQSDWRLSFRGPAPKTIDPCLWYLQGALCP